MENSGLQQNTDIIQESLDQYNETTIKYRSFTRKENISIEGTNKVKLFSGIE